MTADATPAVQPTDAPQTPTAAELGAEAVLLAVRAERLHVVRQLMSAADEEWTAAIERANAKLSATAGPLALEKAELVEAVARSQAAADEIAARKRRVAELREQLAEAEWTLPPE